MNLQEELKTLKERIAELEQLDKDEQNFPKIGDKYWHADYKGDILVERWENFNIENEMLEIGNIFRTREQAEFAVEKLKVEAELRKFSRPFERGGNNHSLFLEIYNNRHRLDIGVRNCYQAQGAIYFESEEKAQQAISTVGEDRIKKYIFGVEE